MPIMRNPFRKQDENVRPATANGTLAKPDGKPPQSIDIKEKPPVEYKLSEINDSGVFVPPSPTHEKRSFWTTSSSRSTTSSHQRSVFNENEPFNISRESFDSYRRSFDISARSPVILPEQKPRISLDSRTFQPPNGRSSNSFHRPLQVPGTQEEEAGENVDADKLEDVSLEDPKPQPQKKRGMFSRMLPDSSSDLHQDRPVSSDGGKWHHFGGRKRGQSGQGSELGSVPIIKREETPRPESQLRKEVAKPSEGQAVPGAETTQAPSVNVAVDAALTR